MGMESGVENISLLPYGLIIDDCRQKPFDKQLYGQKDGTHNR